MLAFNKRKVEWGGKKISENRIIVILSSALQPGEGEAKNFVHPGQSVFLIQRTR